MPPVSLVFYFFIYSFLGWILDTTCRSFVAHTFTTGNFFPVPLCPIYGFGVLLVIILHKTFPKTPILLQGLVYGVLLATLEYLTGYFTLLFFHRRLWLYAGGLLNLDNFTNLNHALMWGVGAVLLVKYFQPALERLFKKDSDDALHGLCSA